MDEDERPEIAVAPDEDSPLLMGNPKHLGVLRLGQAQLSGRDNVVPQPPQKANGAGVDILVS